MCCESTMWNKSRKRFISSLIFYLLTIPKLNHANPLLIDIEPSILTESMHTLIEYMAKLFCSNQFTYRFNHIYVERSLSTSLADKLINQINDCMTAGVLVSRYIRLKFHFITSLLLFFSILDTILMERTILGFQIPNQWPIPLLVFMQIN